MKSPEKDLTEAENNQKGMWEFLQHKVTPDGLKGDAQ